MPIDTHVPRHTPRGTSISVRLRNEYIPERHGAEGWETYFYPDENTAATVLRKFAKTIEHPEGIDSEHAMHAQDAFWRYINRHDADAYLSYAVACVQSADRRAFDAVLARLRFERTPDPANPFVNDEFKLLADRRTCRYCDSRLAKSLMSNTVDGITCGDCISLYYTYTVDSPEVYVRTSNTAVVDRIGEVRAGRYTHNYLETCLYRCRHSGLYFEDASTHAEAGCCADRNARFIYNYHGTTPIQTHGWPRATPKNSLCFGVELEMEHKESKEQDEDEDNNDDYSQMQKSICRALRFSDGTDRGGIPGVEGRYVLEHDGSLNESGVELVTCPYTLDFHQTRFGWDKLLAEVSGIAMSGKGTTACGMHVHVNRKALSALTLGKMLVFVNAENNTRLIRQVAQRDSERWAERYEKSIRQGKDLNSDKYQAMHLSENTVEFRIFRGNLKPERVLKNIEFVHSVVCYCRAASIQEIESPEGYHKWLFKHRGTYRNLVKFLGIANPNSTDA
jgi:uridine kinase